jgi:phosphate transport system protein
MDTTDLKHHFSQRFNTELEQLRTRVLEMGGLVERQLERAIAALNSGESQVAEAVVSNDCKVNACDVQIDEQCTKILALRKPTASDLRLVLAVIKKTADLERIGDRCCNISEYIIYFVKGKDVRHTSFDQIKKEFGAAAR